jgi:hypothetical protein
MQLWQEAEIKIRRENALGSARSSGLAKRAGVRTTKARDRVASVVEALSDALAALARSLRNGETA